MTLEQVSVISKYCAADLICIHDWKILILRNFNYIEILDPIYLLDELYIGLYLLYILSNMDVFNLHVRLVYLTRESIQN